MAVKNDKLDGLAIVCLIPRMREAFISMLLGFVCLTIEADDAFPKIPATPALLIETLKKSGDGYTIAGTYLNYVKEEDLPFLVSLLNSEEPCAFVDSSFSSIYFPGRSTVGREAAYLIEGFWKRFYPFKLTSRNYEPDLPQIKLWYRQWSFLKEREKAQDHPSADNLEIEDGRTARPKGEGVLPAEGSGEDAPRSEESANRRSQPRAVRAPAEAL